MSAATFRGDPYRVLDVRHDASAEEIKRRWRELAREHHPDRVAHDGEDRERLTTRMARINAAYDVLRDPVRRARFDATPLARRERYAQGHPPGGSSGPPPPPSPPVTARFDTSASFRQRNGTLRRRTILWPGQPPIDWRTYRHGPDLRSSQPNGPVYRRVDAAKIRLPSLHEAQSTVLGFGRFHGLTLGEVAEREPTYIDWIAATITRDRDLVVRARVVANDLDERGVVRRHRMSGMHAPGA